MRARSPPRRGGTPSAAASRPPSESKAESAGGVSAAEGKLPSGCDANRPQQQSSVEGHLYSLRAESPRRVLIVRRINALGFESQELLEAHYSQFGTVLRVLVAHSKVKPHRSKKAATQSRVRPGSMGFIVMEDAKSVDRILQLGSEQSVAGRRVSVEAFRATVSAPAAPLGAAGTGEPDRLGSGQEEVALDHRPDRASLGGGCPAAPTGGRPECWNELLSCHTTGS